MMMGTVTDRDDNNCYSRVAIVIFEFTADSDNYHWDDKWESKYFE